MSGETEPSVPSVPREGAERALDEGPRTEPTEVPPSSVRASAPTLHDAPDALGPRPRPVLVRTPVPPSALDSVVPALSTETTTDARPSRAPNTLRSGGARGLVGATLGRYEVLEEVGHGGMATVYRARDPRLERDVALKVIHRHLRDNQEIAQRFQHEAKAVAKLRHPSIVEIYDVPDVDEDEERFLVAELVEGPSLRRYLQDLRGQLGHDVPGLFPPEIAAALVLQILSALGRAHEEGIIHRDVKPENILLAGLPNPRPGAKGPVSSRPSDPARATSIAKLTDFGIAKILDAQGMTSTGQILGSPAHMAPEQIEAGEIGPRVDLFATGVLFYELLTGGLPFDGKNPAQVIRRVLDGEFTPAERACPSVGGRWSAIVSRLLARDPERRPASVDEVVAAIRAELDAMGIVDPDAELAAFVRDPATVARGWGERMKPRLLERGLAARDAGDVVGSANDLNRALAYDPTDPRLVRAVGTMRARERRLRTLRRVVPFFGAAVLVVSGTFGVVRWSRLATVGAPPASASALPTTEPAPTVTTTAVAATTGVSTATSPPPPTVDAAPPSATTTAIGTTTAATGAPPATSAPAAAIRKVRFQFNVGAEYRVDGGQKFDSLNSLVELSIGEHVVTAVGNNSCCEVKTQKFKVEPGEGPQTVAVTLVLKPFTLHVIGAEGAKVTVKNKQTGAVVWTGTGTPARIPMGDDTNIPATITVEATGFPPKTADYTLVPGDTRSFVLEGK